MSRKKGGFMNLLYGSIMPKIYGIGAAIVIVGALFKILHWEGANTMLFIGLMTEAIIFFLSAFEPKHSDPDWSRVYPELADDFDGEPTSRLAAQSNGNGSITKKLDHMLESNKIGPELIQSLGQGMQSLAVNAKQMANLSNAAVATEEYATNVRGASKSLVEMNKSYGSTVEAMSAMASASKDAKEYHNQVQNVTKNLGALNAVYEMELQDANSHVKAMNKFYASISSAMDNMAQASKESEQFKKELSALTTNLSSLNNVYGSMLTAMRSGGQQQAR
ncbi:type IX secretion system motor protein PorL/GldL [Cesiribacter andamanensis]|uniref:Gliding motility-associated protein GldL n=1 Tax=Cesiribacter andamanensis AMV16 TaxID=1279009 RepID=M7NZL9_9BACT|nr:gliding motility protein GldL [Cesiribacter andamanensis]EMR03784.1 gliding motility-associated protein GldL [Cesiribacter andamanensis AMV16]